MIFQSYETNVSVSVNQATLPAVTAVDIELERSVEGNTVDTESGKYRVTVKRYLPVGVEVGNLFSLEKFSVTVTDCWNSYTFAGCEWVKLERKLDNNGVYETMVAQAKLIQVI